MAKGDVVEAGGLPPGREQLTEVRFQVGSVHWNGARIITHATTDETRKTVAGTHMLIAEGLWLHPAGVLIKVDGNKYIVPHARVEVYTLA